MVEGPSDSGAPSSDEEWDVHAINIQGVFFEQWVERRVRCQDAWALRATKVPVDFPSARRPGRQTESELDLWIERRFEHTSAQVLIECKKRNPEFVNWVFFERLPQGAHREIWLPRLKPYPQSTGSKGKQWAVERETRSTGVSERAATDVRETRGKYGDVSREKKTKSSNSAVTEAAHQVALAVRAVVEEEAFLANKLGARDHRDQWVWPAKTFVPCIVTTAALHWCNYSPDDVDAATGEVRLDSASLESVPSLVYEYPVPRHLQPGLKNAAAVVAEGRTDVVRRLPIHVVNSEHFDQFLEKLVVGPLLSESHAKNPQVSWLELPRR